VFIKIIIKVKLSLQKPIILSLSRICLPFKVPEAYYRTYKNLSLVLVLSQMNPIRTLPSYFLNLSFSSIVPSTPRFSKWSIPVRFPD
jgi:hypothetical protein